MKRTTRRITKQAHWYYNGTGFPTKREALHWVASHAALRKGATMSDVLTIAKHLGAVMRELSRVEKVNK